MPPSTTQAYAPAAAEVAKILLDIKAVNFRPEQPYILTSGHASPVYIDCRKIISFPKERSIIIKHMAAATKAMKFDAYAGGETAGIPFAAWLAHEMNAPMLYIRKKPKGFGRNAQIEGDLKDNSKVLLVEELATDGGSKVNFVNALRTASAEVTHSIVIFYYGAFPLSPEFTSLGINLIHLCTWKDVLAVAESGKYFDAAKIEGVKQFLADPITWSHAHGGGLKEKAAS
ncbi:MAG: orotate phosphoribosyltransferase [Dongiaceae bacterium]